MIRNDNRTLPTLAALGFLASAAAACSSGGGDVMTGDARTNDATTDVQVGMDAGPDAATEAGPDAAPPTDGPSPTDASDSGTVACPSNPAEVVISGEINTNQNWTCQNTYVLRGGTIFVTNNAVVSIGPGTVIKGDSPASGAASSLVFTVGARLLAAGTAAQPIVFTSYKAPGTRAPSDWGGIVLMGNASINAGVGVTTDGGLPTGTDQIEGLPATEMRGRYGGGTSPDDNNSCGLLRYVRVEFAAREIAPDNELNGITLAGCGTGTLLDHVQVHKSGDDGVEFFGGRPNVKYLVLTDNEDDGFDWDLGFSGKAQFVIIRGPNATGENDPNGIEADNNRNANNATPRSSPTLWNFTVFGAGNTVNLTKPNYGAVLRRGTAGTLRNFIFGGFYTAAVDVRDQASFDQANATPSALTIENSIFTGNGTSGIQHFLSASTTPAESPADSFDEAAFFTAGARNNRTDMGSVLMGAYNVGAPNFQPAASSLPTTGAATPPSDGFFEPANYVGAVPPAPGTDWTAGWTAYPAN